MSVGLLNPFVHALGGVGVEVGSFTKQAGTGNQDITIATDLTAAAAGSWAIVFWMAGSDQATGVWDTYALPILGFVANGGGTISEYSIACYSVDGVGTSDTARRMAAKCITMPTNTGGGTLYEANFTAFQTATSMRLNWSTNSADAQVINYMIISGLTGAKVVNFNLPAAAGDKTITGAGFNPDLALFASAYTAALPGSSANAFFSFGMANKHGQQVANSFGAADAQVGSSGTDRWQQTDACLLGTGSDDSIREHASLVEMNSDGCKLYFANNALGATFFGIALFMDGVSSKIGAFAASGTAQTVDSRHGFTPKAAMLSTIGRAPIGAPEAHATWGLGASDLTNERSSYLTDIDAVATTQTDSVWYSDKILATHSGAGTTESTFDLASVALDAFSLSMSVTPSGDEVLYLLLGDSGTDTFPVGTLDTATTNAAATAYSNQKKGVELSNGYLVRVVGETTTNARFEYSTDSGKTWVDYASDIAGWNNGSIDFYEDSSGDRYIVGTWKQSGVGGGRTDGHLYAMVGTLTSSDSVLTWGTAVAVYSGAVFGQYPDLVVFAEGTGGSVQVVGSYADGSNNNITMSFYAAITAGGVLGAFTQTNFTNHGNNNHTFPSIDYDPATKRLFVAWSAGTTGAGKGIRFRTASYSAGAWTWAAEVEVDTTTYSDHQTRPVICRFKGTRCYIVTVSAVGATYKLRIRDSSNFTSFDTRVDEDLGLTTNMLFAASVVVDPTTEDVYVFGQRYDGSVMCDVAYRKATRTGAALALGTRVITDAFISVAGSGYPYAFPITGGIGFVWTRGNNAPYSVVYDRILTS